MGTRRHLAMGTYRITVTVRQRGGDILSDPLFRSDKAGGGHPGVSRFNRDPEPGGLGPFYGSVLLATTSLEPAQMGGIVKPNGYGG